jgi:hypothetical protein
MLDKQRATHVQKLPLVNVGAALIDCVNDKANGCKHSDELMFAERPLTGLCIKMISFAHTKIGAQSTLQHSVY